VRETKMAIVRVRIVTFCIGNTKGVRIVSPAN
jgi:hypothetical protein